MGATVAIDVSKNSGKELDAVMTDLGMQEGFDVGLEMSGNMQAFMSMLDVMNNGGKISFLGIPPKPFAIDWNVVVFKGLTIKGIYGRRIFETWYKMSSMLVACSRLDSSYGIRYTSIQRTRLSSCHVRFTYYFIC